MTSTVTIIEPRTETEVAAFRTLNWAYRDLLLALPPEFATIVRKAYTEDKYRALLEASEVENRPPRGMMRLALLGGTPVGVGTVQTIAPGDAEIKRVYVAPEAQGSGIGRKLMLQLIDDCRSLGFERILMDTGQVQAAAQALYASLGFSRRGPYQPMPPEADGRMVFYEMKLAQPD